CREHDTNQGQADCLAFFIAAVTGGLSSGKDHCLKDATNLARRRRLPSAMLDRNFSLATTPSRRCGFVKHALQRNCRTVRRRRLSSSLKASGRDNNTCHTWDWSAPLSDSYALRLVYSARPLAIADATSNPTRVNDAEWRSPRGISMAEHTSELHAIN